MNKRLSLGEVNWCIWSVHPSNCFSRSDSW